MKYMLKLTSLTAILLALMSGALLFWVSQQVQQVEREQKNLAAANSQQAESIRVLKAEWDYLNRPERLELLADKYLNMAPASADTLLHSISAIPEPEEPALPPEEQIVPVSTAAPARKASVAEIKNGIQLPPPVLTQNEPSQEEQFGKVLEDAESGQ